MELIQVQIFFRHGARTPLYHCKTAVVEEALWIPDLAEDLSFTTFSYNLVNLNSRKHMFFDENAKINVPKLPGGLHTGELVKAGQIDAYELGKRLKRTYIDDLSFISNSFCSSECYLRTTFIGRTVKSLRCVLAGMFGEHLVGNKDVVPVSFEVMDIKNEFLFLNPHLDKFTTALYAKGLEESYKSKEHLEMKELLKKTLSVKKLYNTFDGGFNDNDCYIYFIRDDFIARKHSSFPIPPGLNELLPEMERLSSIELLWELLGCKVEWADTVYLVTKRIFCLIAYNIIYHKSFSKFHLYSTHDTSLLCLLFGLGVFDETWPPFSADLALELYSSKTNKLDSKACTTSNQEVGTFDASTTQLNWTKSQLDGLWFRLLYLGKPLDLYKFWNISTNLKPSDEHRIEYLVPVYLLFEKISKSLI